MPADVVFSLVDLGLASDYAEALSWGRKVFQWPVYITFSCFTLHDRQK
jgi:hypothetical protein